ncbi:uncharacterized protein EV154DRAFT_529599 [Mucor mucedo]|uniref:uncharacterized protein n=1 Tax=Mucor mucedo TaxID=29922 RepID=UPI002220542F|nr:uncharacterized protein EV154DRAFT_529599 [Mucor mucedo]KAI7871389.1 hypothetical protein EV154DRAFT_529599 [Mucor mucedo]
MSISPEFTWADIAAVGNAKKVLRPIHVSDETDSEYKRASTIIYEDECLEALFLTQQAMSIVKQKLIDGSVLFSFPATAIESQCGPLHGVRPISYYGVLSDSNMLLEVKFLDDGSTMKAITSGVSVKDKIFKGFPTNFSDKNTLVQVKFSILYIPDQENFLEDLLASLAFYGQVLQIKEYSCGRYFEGQMSVILNTAMMNITLVPLSNNLYLSEWDCFATATFKGAPSVCHWCHVAGHIRSKCPELAKTKCFVCHSHGHTAKFCKRGKRSVVRQPVFAEVSQDIDLDSTDCLDANILSDSDTDISDVSTSPKIASRGSDASKFATTVASVSGDVDYVMDTTTLPSSNAELVGRTGGTDKGLIPQRSALGQHPVSKQRVKGTFPKLVARTPPTLKGHNLFTKTKIVKK